MTKTGQSEPRPVSSSYPGMRVWVLIGVFCATSWGAVPIASAAESSPSRELVSRRGLVYQLLRAGQARQSIEACRAALQRFPEDPELLDLLAEAKEATVRPRVRRGAPEDDTDERLDALDLALDRGEAERVAGKLASIRPRTADQTHRVSTLHARIELARSRSELDALSTSPAGAARLERVAAAPPSDPAVRLDLAGMFLELGRIELARGLVPAGEIPKSLAARRVSFEALLLERRGDRGPARELLDRQPAPTDPEAAVALAEARLGIGDGAGALLLVTGLPAGAAQSPAATRVRVTALAALGRISEARAAVPARPSTESPDRALDAIELLMEVRRNREAETQLASLPAPARERVRARAAQARLSLSAGDSQSALALSRELVAARPHAPEFCALLAEALLAGARVGEARETSERALAEFPGHLGLSLALAHAMSAQGQAAGALALAESLSTGHERAGLPVPRDVLLARAGAFNQLGRAREAEALLRPVVARDADCEDALRELADAANRLGRAGEALALHDRAVALSGQNRTPDRIARATYLLRARGRHEAAAELESLVSQNPRDADALAALADLHATDPGRQKRALALYHDALAIKPDHAARVRLAALLLERAHLRAAERELSLFRSAHPLDIAGELTATSIEVARGDLARSRSELGRLRVTHPEDEDVWLESSLVSSALGAGYLAESRQLAREARRRAAGMEPGPRGVAGSGAAVSGTAPVARSSWPLLAVPHDALYVTSSPGVTGATRPLFRPASTSIVTREVGSDSLVREEFLQQVSAPAGDRAVVRGGPRFREVSRLALKRGWTDATLGATWNVTTGHAIDATLLAGEAGDASGDVLPSLAWSFTSRSGSGGGVGVARRRIEESPEALDADLESEPFSAFAQLRRKRFLIRIDGMTEGISDGNRRESVSLLAEGQVLPRVIASVQHQEQRARFEPALFAQYFAPLDYSFTTVGLDISPLIVANAVRVSLTPRLVWDEQNGAQANGGSIGLRAIHTSPTGARLALRANHFFLGASRRLGDDTPYRQDEFEASYEVVF